jgi:hypothetical protein
MNANDRAQILAARPLRRCSTLQTLIARIPQPRFSSHLELAEFPVNKKTDGGLSFETPSYLFQGFDSSAQTGLLD